MLQINLHMAKPGMKLALPVRHPLRRQQTLLTMGFVLDESTITRLLELGVRRVWVGYPSLTFLSEYINPEVMESQDSMVNHVVHTFESLQQQSTAKLNYHDYCKSIGTMVKSLVGNPKAAFFLGDLMDSENRDLIRHSSAVMYLSVLMGLKLEGYLVKQRRHITPARAKEVINLGLGAMLHDVGVTYLPLEVRQRYDETGDEQDVEWQQHTVLGYRVVRGQVEASASTVVLNHHQRFDGSGYAGKEMPILAGERIHVFSRIAGLADQFDRMRNPVNQPPRLTVAVLNDLLKEDLAKKFDPQVMQALLSVVPPYPPTSIVRLNDGHWAVCIDHVPTDPCRPVVQIIPDPSQFEQHDLEVSDVLDLSEMSASLYIAEFEGQDVSQFNFRRPPIMSPQMHHLIGLGRQADNDTRTLR